MRNHVIAILLLAQIASCKPQESNHTAPSEKTIVMVEADYSKSAGGLRYFDTPDARNLYFTLAVHSVAEIKFLPINANSAAHDILSLTVQACDTVSTAGVSNIYQIAKANARNR